MIGHFEIHKVSKNNTLYVFITATCVIRLILANATFPYAVKDMRDLFSDTDSLEF